MTQRVMLIAVCLLAMGVCAAPAHAEIASAFPSDSDGAPRDLFETHEDLYVSGTITNVFGTAGRICVVKADTVPGRGCSATAFGTPLPLFASAVGLHYTVDLVRMPLRPGRYAIMAEKPGSVGNFLSEE